MRPSGRWFLSQLIRCAEPLRLSSQQLYLRRVPHITRGDEPLVSAIFTNHLPLSLCSCLYPSHPPLLSNFYLPVNLVRYLLQTRARVHVGRAPQTCTRADTFWVPGADGGCADNQQRETKCRQNPLCSCSLGGPPLLLSCMQQASKVHPQRYVVWELVQAKWATTKWERIHSQKLREHVCICKKNKLNKD